MDGITKCCIFHYFYQCLFKDDKQIISNHDVGAKKLNEDLELSIPDPKLFKFYNFDAKNDDFSTVSEKLGQSCFLQ